MRKKSRIRPFPVQRLKRFDGGELELIERSGHQGWLAPVAGSVSNLARRFGLGAAGVEVRRVQVVKIEDLRETFPGRWCFAWLCDPLAERFGFLALDPLLCGRVLSRLQVDGRTGRGWGESSAGTAGALGWVVAEVLEELSGGEDGDDWSGWRFLGLVESAGEIGRNSLSENALVVTWLSVNAGWERGFAAWLEPESSLNRRTEYGHAGEELVGGLPVTLSWVAGKASLRLEEFSLLEPGDVVLLEEDESERQTILRQGSLSISGSLDGRDFRVTDIRFEDGGEVMSGPEIVEKGNGSGLEAAELGRLPVEIVAEAGRMHLTVSQLGKIRAGHVLALPVAVLGPLDLRAGGRLVARGELVDIEGQRGIRLLEVALPTGEPHEDVA